MILAGLVGCAPPSGDCFSTAESWFESDGPVSTYVNDEVDWPLQIAKESDDDDVVTYGWTRGDTGERLGSVVWSTGYPEGARIQGWQAGDGDFTWFDEPVVVAGDTGCFPGGSPWETTTNGTTFVSTLVGWEDCPNDFDPSWDGCVHIRIDDGDGDDATGPIFAGDWWQTHHYGTMWLRTTGFDSPWKLEDFEDE